MPGCTAPVLARLTELVRSPGLTCSPAPLLALVDALEAHSDHGCEVGPLLLALRLLHSSAVLRGAGQHDDALLALDVGAELLRACLLPVVNVGSL